MHCSGIHNYLPSSVTFSALEKQFLANGLNFACTPPSTRPLIYQHHYFNDPSRGWLRFARTLDSALLHGQQASDEGYLTKFAVKNAHAHHAVNYMADTRREQHAAEQLLLDRYFEFTRNALQRHTSNALSFIHRQPRNVGRADLQFMQRLMADASITIKPADKNLGMVLVSTEWYHTELMRMLSDRVTYRPFNNDLPSGLGRPGRRSTTRPLDQLQQALSTALKDLAAKAELKLRLWNPQLADQVLKYLTSAVTLQTCAVPGIYLLIKVHKARLSGRPIVPSTHWLTTPASVVVDHLLQEVLHRAAIAHLVKDTKSFVNELEQLYIPPTHRDGVFVTADIASLYTNIDTEDGITQVHRFLILQSVSNTHSELILSLLRFVMNNSYLTYRNSVWHQIDGTAMGTACAPAYANIVVFMRERDVLDDMQQRGLVYLYRRFLDDIFAYVPQVAVAELQHRLNSLHPKLKFEFVLTEREAAFLDLSISKGTRFAADGRFDLSVHQKAMNLYLYIPYCSFHTDAMKRSFIQTELMRYVRNSSDVRDYYAIRTRFYQRLRDRGYPHAFLAPIFNSVVYDDRPYFLWPVQQLLSCPQRHIAAPRSATLLRRMARLRAAALVAAAPTSENAVAQALASDSRQQPLVFVVPYSPLSRLVPTRSLLARHWALVRDALGQPSLPPPIIAYQSAPSLVKQLVFQKAKLHQQARTNVVHNVPGPGSSAGQQQSLLRFLTAAQQPSTLPVSTDEVEGGSDRLTGAS